MTCMVGGQKFPSPPKKVAFFFSKSFVFFVYFFKKIFLEQTFLWILFKICLTSRNNIKKSTNYKIF